MTCNYIFVQGIVMGYSLGAAFGWRGVMAAAVMGAWGAWAVAWEATL